MRFLFLEFTQDWRVEEKESSSFFFIDIFWTNAMNANRNPNFNSSINSSPLYIPLNFLIDINLRAIGKWFSRILFIRNILITEEHEIMK